ncbi:hypothetical protein PHLCEN_2v2653 [Hermanssonia centrifuga]|uniref:Uncharacterized protein n=1 Tax=Hermanssonia centrifuga TaxID=98765 RepID=A0A2R6RIL1_9APHY|nr:hypothetical protein PHLCEN_2v2653 [Hermanssonia centrifuga]
MDCSVRDQAQKVQDARMGKRLEEYAGWSMCLQKGKLVVRNSGDRADYVSKQANSTCVIQERSSPTQPH